MDYYPELTELAEAALAKVMPSRDNIMVTRGVVIAELLTLDQDSRSVIAVQFGRQGAIPPYDIIGLIIPVQMAAERAIAEQMTGGIDP